MASPRNRHCANCIGALSFPACEMRERTNKQTDTETPLSYEYRCTGPNYKEVSALLQ